MKMKMKMKMKFFSLGVALLCCFGDGTNAYAYNRDTHQHITELAYAYLKLMDSCQPIEYDGTQACEEDCKQELQAKNLERGFTCNCLWDVCGNRGPKCTDLTDGYDAYLCTLECTEDGSFGTQCLDPKLNNGCSPPYYFHDDWATDIISDTCRRSCLGTTTSELPIQCKSLVNVFESPFIETDSAKSTVDFFQNFKASPCPNRTYSYHGMNQCDDNPATPIKLEDGSATRPAYLAREKLWGSIMPLVEWSSAVGAGYRFGSDAREVYGASFRTEYIPVQGDQLSSTRFIGDSYSIDYTGTILGFHAGVVDKLDDLHFTLRGIPVVEDSIKTALEIAVAGGAAALGAAAAIGGILGCALTCPVTLFFGTCDDCFSEVFSAVGDILEAGDQAVTDIEENTWIGTNPTTEVDGIDATSMFHFMNQPSIVDPFKGVYDDVDGFTPATAFGPVGYAVGQAYQSLQWDHLVDVRVSYPESRRVLENYQISASDDGDRNSVNRPLHYWTRLGVLDYTFPPVDNLAYYWWHKWFNSRLNGKAEEVGLLPLGAVFHAVQDITQPFHAWGVSLNGHVPYEDWISAHLDPTSALLRHPTDPPTDLIWDLNNPNAEDEFLALVSEKINQIYREVIAPNGNVLHIRKLVHFLYGQVVDAETQLKWTKEEGLKALSSGGFDYGPERTFVRETAIPLSVAASVVIMIEASRQDLDEYESKLGLKLSDFEHQGSVPPLSAAHEGGAPGALTTIDAQPAWKCASESVLGIKAMEDYYGDRLSGREALRALFTEKSRCDFQEVGMPTDEPLLQTLGRLEADRMESVMRFVGHGDVALLEKEVACANAQASSFIAPENGDLFAARCGGTLDSDFDGIVDQLDQCATPRKLLQEGYVVNAQGCVFSHEAEPVVNISNFILGTVKK